MAERLRVAGIGGVFFKAARPTELAAWYGEHLGVPVAGGETYALFSASGPDTAGAPAPCVWAAFPADTDYFGPDSAPWMINYRVADFDAMLAQLRAAGVAVEDRIEETAQGRFGWAADPEGHRFELWQPPAAGI